MDTRPQERVEQYIEFISNYINEGPSELSLYSSWLESPDPHQHSSLLEEYRKLQNEVRLESATRAPFGETVTNPEWWRDFVIGTFDGAFDQVEPRRSEEEQGAWQTFSISIPECVPCPTLHDPGARQIAVDAADAFLRGYGVDYVTLIGVQDGLSVRKVDNWISIVVKRLQRRLSSRSKRLRLRKVSSPCLQERGLENTKKRDDFGLIPGSRVLCGGSYGFTDRLIRVGPSNSCINFSCGKVNQGAVSFASASQGGRRRSYLREVTQ